jgi:16S rRNA (uracil1498-N3)-methyltransferase
VDRVHGGIAELRGDDARHLTRVLRAEAGQQYEVSDNQTAYLAEITEARGDRVAFRMIEALEPVRVPVRIVLCAALTKFDRFEWMIEKATELGVERILPVETARSEKGLFEAARKRMERWGRVARESSQQSRRVQMPEILPAVRFERALDEAAEYRYFLEEAGAPALLATLPAQRTDSDRVAILAGPEGGWTDTERSAAQKAGWKAVSLGPLVLRSETACAAAIAVVTNGWMVNVHITMG